MAEHGKEKKGKKMNKHIFYDKENDILSIHKGFASDERFKGNIDVGDLVLDVSTQGRIKGLEIMNAQNFFKDFDINKKILNNITCAGFNADIKPNSIIITIRVKGKNLKQEIPAKIAVPLELPISS